MLQAGDSKRNSMKYLFSISLLSREEDSYKQMNIAEINKI